MVLKWLPERAALGFSVRCPSVNHDYYITLNNNWFHEPLYKKTRHLAFIHLLEQPVYNIINMMVT